MLMYLFLQTMEINVDELEPEFHNIIDVNGNRVTKLFANKGL
jgi:hypothetical protein